MGSLSGRRIAITGATGGIGQELARALHDRGAALALTGRREAVLRELAGTMRGGAPVIIQAADITREDEVIGVLQRAADELGGVDVLINLAGFSQPTVLAETTLADFDALMAANLTGTFLASKHFLAGTGSDRLIVNMASIAGIRANATAPLYCTAKAAVRMFSEGLALQAAELGVRVCRISPGAVATEFWGDRPVDKSAMLTAQDVVRALLFVIEAPAYLVVRDLVFESAASSLRPS